MLDLVISDDSFVENINYDSPLAKSDHRVLQIECAFKIQNRDNTEKFAFSKGDYVGLRNSLQVDWEDKLLPYVDDVNDMWMVFKSELEGKISLFIPKTKSFNVWKKDSWSRPLDLQVRKMISKKRRLWTRYIETRDDKIFKKYKSSRNAVCREIRKLHKLDQQQVAAECKENP